jgi:hypothetical protein
MEAGLRNKLASERMKPTGRNMGEFLAFDDSSYTIALGDLESAIGHQLK